MPWTSHVLVGACQWVVDRVFCLLYVRIMYVEGAGCWLSGVGMSPGTWSLKLLREVTHSNHGLLSHAPVSAWRWATLRSW